MTIKLQIDEDFFLAGDFLSSHKHFRADAPSPNFWLPTNRTIMITRVNVPNQYEGGDDNKAGIWRYRVDGETREEKLRDDGLGGAGIGPLGVEPGNYETNIERVTV